MKKDLGKLSRKLLKDKYNREEGYVKLHCPAPEPHIAEDKPAILFIGMNPAGGETDAERDKKTNGLFLNYYEEFDDKYGLSYELKNSKDSSKVFVYKDYFKPILDFFNQASGKEIAWEWCNYELEDLYMIIEKTGLVLTESDKECLKRCHEKYNKEAKYQLIIRDLVYYHQTKKFNTLLKRVSEPEVKETVKELIDSYIATILEKSNIKLIYASSATTCNYIMTLPKDGKKMESFGGFYYNGIPVILAGRPLNGEGVIDNYSKMRLLVAVEDLLNK